MEKPPLRKRWKRWRNRALITLAKYTLPYLYVAYMRLVWFTSNIIDESDPLSQSLNQPPHKFVGTLWHQDVFFVPWVYRRYHPHTLASVGDAGEIISKILQLCQFSTILRGGSSKGHKRHKEILTDLIAHMQQHQGSLGITVDGSYGPAYRLKRGAVVVAKECGCHIWATRIWCKRRILLSTWDKTAIPLPFNTIRIQVAGPFTPPNDLDDPQKFEQFRHRIETEMLNLTYRLFGAIDSTPPPKLMALFPPDWKLPD